MRRKAVGRPERGIVVVLAPGDKAYAGKFGGGITGFFPGVEAGGPCRRGKLQFDHGPLLSRRARSLGAEDVIRVRQQILHRKAERTGAAVFRPDALSHLPGFVFRGSYAIADGGRLDGGDLKAGPEGIHFLKPDADGRVGRLYRRFLPPAGCEEKEHGSIDEGTQAHYCSWNTLSPQPCTSTAI